MNGAMALPAPNTINIANNSNIIITGANQNFLRSFIKSQRSFKNSILFHINYYFCLNIHTKHLQQTYAHIHSNDYQF